MPSHKKPHDVAPSDRPTQLLTGVLGFAAFLGVGSATSDVRNCGPFEANNGQVVFYLDVPSAATEVQLRIPLGYFTTPEDQFSGVRKGSQVFLFSTQELSGLLDGNWIYPRPDGSNETTIRDDVKVLIGDWQSPGHMLDAYLELSYDDQSRASHREEYLGAAENGLHKIDTHIADQRTEYFVTLSDTNDIQSFIECPNMANSQQSRCAHYARTEEFGIILDYHSAHLKDWQTLQDAVDHFFMCAARN